MAFVVVRCYSDTFLNDDHGYMAAYSNTHSGSMDVDKAQNSSIVI